MLENINIENILFLDIETVPLYPEYNNLPEGLRKLWDKKSLTLSNKEEGKAEHLYEKAGIYAEFGKIICISVGFIKDNMLRIKSFYDNDEKKLLGEFISLLNHYYNNGSSLLCGHNAKEFDYPYIARRILINNLKLPKILDISGKKPWENAHLDTMQLWRFGDYKSYTSLALLTEIFNIPTSKDDIEGSDVARVYWKENDLERIARYCEKDVIAVVQIFLKLTEKDIISNEKIIIKGLNDNN